ncbi:MAG TPA: alpha/beta hydrolase [Allocoleopsis sp.]
MPQYHQLSCQHSTESYQISYIEWGDPHQENVLICVHGLTRNSKDFDHLAQELQSTYRIICPDVVGRGQSDWLSHPANYGIPLYVSDLLTLIQQLNLTSVDWLGTSMGGLIGMNIASLPHSPIKRLILNDVGAEVAADSLQRIAKYLCQQPPIFDDFTLVTEYVKKIYSGFGDLTEDQWEFLARNSVKLNSQGQYILNYDPAISTPFLQAQHAKLKPADLWKMWDLIQCPVLLLHGENSDLLLPETIDKMLINHPLLTVKHLANCGHAPALMSLEQIDMIRMWLNNT